MRQEQNSHIKALKTSSLLKEALQEAFFALEDTRINALNITRVECKKKESARVFLDGSGLSKDEQKEILKLVKNATHIVQEHLFAALSWYKIPALSYAFDAQVEQMDALNRAFREIDRAKKDADE